jgi:hypothetical protein
LDDGWPGYVTSRRAIDVQHKFLAIGLSIDDIALHIDLKGRRNWRGGLGCGSLRSGYGGDQDR